MTRINLDIDVDELRERLFCFDSNNPNWVNSAEHNLFFLRAHQNIFNDMLRARGHVFLNDILETIGMVRTIEGAVVGWVLNFQDPVYIEFHLYHNIDNNAVDIQFNIQGIILYHLESAHSISVAQHGITKPNDQGER